MGRAKKARQRGGPNAYARFAEYLVKGEWDPVVEKFLSWIDSRSKAYPGLKNTRRAYQRDLHQFLLYCSTHSIPPQSLRPRHIDDFLTTLMNEKTRVPRPLSPGSRNRKRASLSSFYRYLRQQELVSVNPVQDVRGFPKTGKLIRPLTLAEIGVIRQGCPPDDRLLLEFLLSTGVRESEAVSLDWNRVDLPKRVATVLGKGGKAREVWFSAYCAKMMTPLQQASGPVFMTRDERPLNVSMVYYRVNRLSRLLPGRNIYPHLFRHTYASLLLSQGVPLTDVRDWLGHTEISTTAGYAHAMESNREKYDAGISILEIGARERSGG